MEHMSFYNTPNVFQALRREYAKLNDQRKMYYYTPTSGNVAPKGELRYRELKNLVDCTSQLYSVEPKLIQSFIDVNPLLQAIPSTEKEKIMVHLVSNMHAVESAYLSWRFSEFRQEFYWVMPNKVFMNMSNLQSHLNSDNVRDRMQIDKLFQLSFGCLTKVVNENIVPMKPAFDELLFLIGLKLYDPTVQNITLETRKRLQQLRELLIDEMVVIYNKIKVNADQRIRYILAVSAGIEEYAHRLREDMLLYRCFNLVHSGDKVFDDAWGICFDF